jgi:transcription-repair coupling factor (superfamily II helicase)
VNNISERLQLYATLDNIKEEESLTKFVDSLKDRFGPLPDSVIQLVNSVRLRWIGELLGFEKISMKNEKLRAYFISGNEDYFKSDVFGKIISFVQGQSKRCRLKESGSKLILTVEKIESVNQAIEYLQPITI